MSGKDFYEFGCAEEQARELLHVIMEYFRETELIKLNLKETSMKNIYQK